MRFRGVETERVPILIADDAKEYADIVSRLIEDSQFYDAACKATREFVVAQPGGREYTASIDHAIATIVRAAKDGAQPAATAPEIAG
jgi:predicted transcriptional regulator